MSRNSLGMTADALLRRSLLRRILCLGLGASSAWPQFCSAADNVGSGAKAETDDDVLVVGSGIAGLCAAISAKESGEERVRILEKGPLIGGHSLYSSGSIAAVAPERVAACSGELGFVDSVEAFVADALAAGGGFGNRAILTRIARESADALDWLESMGVRFGAPFQAHSGLKPRSFSMRGNSAGRSYVLALATRARSLGIPIEMRCRVVSIARSKSADARWFATVQTRRGEQRCRARKIVLATGGFTANVERRRAILPMLSADIGTTANPDGSVWEGADGDGIDLACRVGGVFLTGFGLQLLPYWGGRLLDYAGGDIYVDAEGRRFVNEALPWTPIAEKIFRLPDKAFWVITDRQSVKGATLGLKLLNGAVRRADTIEGMALAMDVPVETLAKTLADYNAAARRGYDPLTGKRTFTQTIDRPPYYFGREHIYVHTTLDGIATDEHARVLDEAGASIPGLYAAGELAGGIFGRDRLGGAGLANCIVMGRVAGRRDGN